MGAYIDTHLRFVVEELVSTSRTVVAYEQLVGTTGKVIFNFMTPWDQLKRV